VSLCFYCNEKATARAVLDDPKLPEELRPIRLYVCDYHGELLAATEYLPHVTVTVTGPAERAEGGRR
jgi:hypothetical protein